MKWPLPLFALAATVACSGPTQLEVEETEGTVNSVIGEVEIRVDRPLRLDLVLVIDNSPSMRAEQPFLANSMGSIIHALDRDDLRVDYRVAVVPTSGASCGDTLGVPVTTSCRSRPEDFVVPEGREADAGNYFADCVASCDLESAPTLPTRTVRDPALKSRPWLQNVDINLRESNSEHAMPAHLNCWAQVGVGGCDYESPFTALRTFLDSTENPNSPNFDFLRDDAPLMVLFISDEDDCSLNQPSILDPFAERAFWPPDHVGERAPSSVCFRAGMQCEEHASDPERWECEAVDRRIDGSITANPSQAALVSVDEMSAYLEDLDAHKLRLYPYESSTTVLTAVVGGFPASGSPYWPKAGGPEGFLAEYGTGPACESFATAEGPPVTAAPSGRIAALVDAVSPTQHFSTCDPDYVVGLSSALPGWGPQLRPACFTECADSDEAPSNSCRVVLEDRYEDIEIPECLRDENGYVESTDSYYTVPDGENICVAYLDDQTQDTESGFDDMSQECLDEGFNLEFKIARRAGAPRIYEGRYVARCLLDADESSCPNL